MRRSMTRSPTAAVRFSVTGEANDVEMSGTDNASQGSVERETPITLPRRLVRPDYRDIRMDTIVAIDPEFADIPLQYIQEGLELTGPE